jgi:hypothetical protein
LPTVSRTASRATKEIEQQVKLQGLRIQVMAQQSSGNADVRDCSPVFIALPGRHRSLARKSGNSASPA